MSSERQNILLLEKNHMVASVITSTARQMNLATVRTVASISNAQHYLRNETFSGLIATIDDELADLQLLYSLRDSAFMTPADTPIIVITPACDEQFAEKLKTLRVNRILIKPFKVRDVISAIELISNPVNA